MRPGGRASAPNVILTAACALAVALGTSACDPSAEDERDAAVITDDAGSTSQLRGAEPAGAGGTGAGGEQGGLVGQGGIGGAGGEHRASAGGATMGAAGAIGAGGAASTGGAAGMGGPALASGGNGGMIGSGGVPVVRATGGTPAVMGSGGVKASGGATGTGGLAGPGGTTGTGGSAGPGGAPATGGTGNDWGTGGAATGGAGGSTNTAGAEGAAGMGGPVGAGAGISGAAVEGGGAAGGPAGAGGTGGATETPSLVDAVTLSSVGELERRRQALRQVIWGQPDLPSSKAVVVDATDNCRLDALAGADHVTELRTPMDAGEEGLGCHYVPATSNHRLVIYNPGHFCTVADGSTTDNDGWPGYGDQRTVESLLAEGYSVLVSYMPHFRPDDCWFGTSDDPHALMFRDMRPARGSPWKYFLEPIVASLNTLDEQAAKDGEAAYQQVDMLGLSGGGWTTVAMSAVDTRIKVSIHVAGTEPLDFWGWESEDEQTLPALYRVAAYRDLYILGAAGEGRHQLHLLNRYDNCCFFPAWSGMTSASWEEALRSSADGIEARLSSLGFAGAYRLHIDDTAVTHQISRVAIANIILPELAMHAVRP